MFFVQINHTGKGFLFLIFREIKLRKYSSLHKLFYGLKKYYFILFCLEDNCLLFLRLIEVLCS
ncbi:hypothetical protein CYJ80_10855 [Lactobacillus crispatus]|nr:hypothetical protein CYJ80_10855 [Lactobacillus crispatus]